MVVIGSRAYFLSQVKPRITQSTPLTEPHATHAPTKAASSPLIIPATKKTTGAENIANRFTPSEASLKAADLFVFSLEGSELLDGFILTRQLFYSAAMACSASGTRNSPLSNFGSSVSRRVARVRDCLSLLAILSQSGSTVLK